MPMASENTTPVVPYKDRTDSKKEQVADMFDNICPPLRLAQQGAECRHRCYLA